MEMEMVMEMVMVIFGAPKTNWAAILGCHERQLGAQMCIEKVLDIRFCGSGSLWTTKRRPGEPQEAPEEPSRGSQEAPWRCFGSSWRSKKLPKPRSSIHSSFSEPRRGLPEVPKSRSIDPVSVLEPPDGGRVRQQDG